MFYLCCRHVPLTLNAMSHLEQHVNVRFFYRLKKSAVETPLKLMVVKDVQLLKNLLFYSWLN